MKLKLGPMVGQASGSIGASTFSHNRYGAYTRLRSIPIISTTAAAMNQKATFGQASTAWSALTAAQRLVWKEWALANPIVDRLGDTRNLDGHAAYVQINARLIQAGIASLSAPPLGVAPDALTTLTATFDIGAGTFELTFTPTPIGAAKSIWVNAAVVNSAAINYVRNLLKTVAISAANQATGYDTETLIEARFGTLSVGQYVHMWVSVLDRATGLLSAPRQVSGAVVST